MNAPKLAGLEPYFCSRNVTLYNADFRDVLPTLAADSIDSIITDPPYAITDLEWDQPVDWTAFWPEAIRVSRPHAPNVLFASGKFVPLLINTNARHYRYDLIWSKNLPVGHLDANRRPLRSHESILIFAKQFRGSRYTPQKTVGKPHTIGKGSRNKHYGKTSGRMTERSTNLYHPRSVLQFDNSRKGRSLHPTQKPLDLMKWLVLTYSDRNDLILDPFAGSGSTLIAAAESGRRAIGIEKNREFCAIIAQRLKVQLS